MTAQRRADLQGLRAVAVLAVIAYHFNIPGISGGFIGVDIFFVLSGFFITRVLMRDIEEHGQIRLGRFWANRVKRLLPNSLLVIVSVLVAAAILLPSYRLPSISGDGISATAFFANFRFAAQTVDYFHLDDPASPFLHYWSLAVEEQFYLALPLLMIGALLLPSDNIRTTILALLTLVAAVSFVASLLVIERSQPEAFFYPQYRAWQLLAGGIVGLLFEQRKVFSQTLRAIGAVAGAIVITASIVLLNDGMSYPGIYALAPTLGTVTLIVGLDAGRYSSMLDHFLTKPLMVVIGDMSYSLYLWHWPVAVFLAAFWPAAGLAVTVAGLVITALLSSAAYYLIERPIHRLPLPALQPWRTLAAGASGVALAAGAAAASTTVLPDRTPAVAALIAESTTDLGPNYHNGCHRDFDDVDQPECRFGKLGGPRVVLFGDSHAAQWFTAIVKAGQEVGWEVNVWTKTSCPSVDAQIWYGPSRSVYAACNMWREDRLRALVENPPQLVILANFAYYYGWLYDAATKRGADRLTSETLWQNAAKRTVDTLIAAGIQVVNLRDTPRMYVGYKHCLSIGEWSNCARPRSEALAGINLPEIDSSLYERLDLSDALCSPLVCPAVIGDRIAYRDSHHLTSSHAATLHEHFSTLLRSRAKLSTINPAK